MAEPARRSEEWYGKVSEALRSKIAQKIITLCVVSGEGTIAYLNVDSENMNDWMLKNGFLDYQKTPPFGFD